MSREVSEDIFELQIRMFRQFQVRENLSAQLTEEIFKKYDVFKYIEICYEVYHVQGDEANINDIYRYLESQEWKR